MGQWKHVTPEMEKVVNDFGSHHLKQRVGLPAGPLYHYTSGESLIKIIQSGQLWGTQAACMNDAKELIYAIEALYARVKDARVATLQDSRLHPLWTAVDDFIAKPSANAAPIFLSCFSERDDDLSQWRGYAGGEGGYSIGFDARKLRALGSPHGVFLFPVDYDEGRLNFLLDDIITWLVKIFIDRPGLKTSPTEKELAEECAAFWLSALSPFAIGVKHRAFEAEREWRLFEYAELPAEIAKFEFRQRSSFMARHLPMRLGGERLPIVSVRIGPCRHPELSRIAVGDLLIKYGYKLAPPSGTGSVDEVMVTESIVPYRHS